MQKVGQFDHTSDDPLTWLLGLHTSNMYINSYLVPSIVLNSTGMDAFSVWHTDLSERSDTRNSFVSIKAAANIFLACDKFYEVLLVFYSLVSSI